MHPPMQQQHQQQGSVLQQQQSQSQPQAQQPQQPQQPQQLPQEQQQQVQQQAAYPGYLHQRKPGDKAHFCICCQTPIAVYGRLTPCLHAFCLACASDMPQCFICLADINRIERHTSPLYISAANLQSFPTEAQLHGHTQKLYKHLKGDPNFALQFQPSAGRPPAAAAATAGGGSWAGRMNAAAAAAAATGQG